MTQVLVKTRDENTLIAECKDIYEQKIRISSEIVSRGYWEIGAKIIQYEAEGWISRDRGSGRIQRIAEILRINYTNLYAAMNLAERFPTEEHMNGLFKDIVARGKEPSWNFIRYQVLPKNAGMPEADKTHELLSAGERAASQVEKVVAEIEEMSQSASREDKEMLQGVKGTLQRTLAEASTALAIPKPKRQADPGYLRWIHEQPEFKCIVTDAPQVEGNKIDAAHTTSVGAQGSDYWVFPLNHELHMESHRDPSWVARHKMELAEWFYNLHHLHARYFEETEGSKI